MCYFIDGFNLGKSKIMLNKSSNTSKTKNINANTEEMSSKAIAKQEKVDRRRSLEEYVARKRWKEENEDLADLYDTECC